MERLVSIPRKLILFFDGSSNSTARREESNSTVLYRLNQAFSNGAQGEQISFYFSGVGTRGDLLSAATGEGLNEIIADAYINLSSNYRKDDLVYIFGFSRGAVAARCLSGLLSEVGLLVDSKLSVDFPNVWRAYSLMGDPDSQQDVQGIRHDLDRDLFHPRIPFIGVFDTVPGDGWDKLKLTELHPLRDFKLSESVEHAVHILSIDDDRLPSFQPLLWMTYSPHQTLDQIWMPGVHGDIGGCSNSVFIGNLAALTMIEHLQLHCPELEFEDDYIRRLEHETFHDRLLVQITNERRRWWMKLLNQKYRTAEGVNQSRHYLTTAIAGRQLLVRGKRQAYCAQHITNSVRVSQLTRYRSEIDRIVDNSLTQPSQCCAHCR